MSQAVFMFQNSSHMSLTVALLLTLDTFSVKVMKKGIFSQRCQRHDERGMCFDSKVKLKNKTKSGVLLKS